jgi:hypothetical protein
MKKRGKNAKHKPDIINIPNVLNFEREYLSAIQPRLGFASPNATPLTRAARNVTHTYREY